MTSSCPFCGGSNIDSSMSRGYLAGDKKRPTIAAGCFDCGAVGPTVNVPHNETGYKQSIEAWNKRVTKNV